jgi:pimeloyl-ACP methyl ester carboxylesterase
VLISPGFQETGRNFYEQIQLLNAQGHDVFVMDHQWAGHSDGKKGGLDRGFGVARDVAAMAGHVQAMLEAEGGENELVLFGNSMGGGPGVLGALCLNDSDQIHLDGPAMPRGLSALLQAPFLGRTPNSTNTLLEAASHIPMINRLAVPSAGIPVLTHDEVGAQKGAQHAVAEDVRARLSAMTAADADLEVLRSGLENGVLPKGRIAIVMGDADPLADPQKVQELAAHLGHRVQLTLLDSKNHVLEENPDEQNAAIHALTHLLTSD